MPSVDLLSPGRIDGFDTRNRMFMAPMTRSRALPGGVPSDLAIEYYGQHKEATNRQEVTMRTIARCFLLFGLVAAVPRVAAAQATLAGEVKDTTGAVLPGVTVEAASPALIEKVRTAVTDGSGRYRIESLPPGSYTVTFSLTGFANKC